MFDSRTRSSSSVQRLIGPQELADFWGLQANKADAMNAQSLKSNDVKLKSPAEYEADAADMEWKLSDAIKRQAEIDDLSGKVLLEGTDKEISDLESEGVRIAQKIKMLERGVDFAKERGAEAARAERISEVKKRRVATENKSKKLLGVYVQLHDHCMELRDLMIEAEELSRSIQRYNEYAEEAVGRDMIVHNPVVALARQRCIQVPVPERNIALTHYWPAIDPNPAWKYFKDLDLNAHLAEQRLSAAERAEKQRAREAANKEAEERRRKKLRDQRKAQAIAERRAREKAEKKKREKELQRLGEKDDQ